MSPTGAPKEHVRKVVIVFAGPNGSGKSTINKAYLSDPAVGFDGIYVNADDIAQTLTDKIPNERSRNIAAAQEAERQRLACFESEQSFAFETVMSTPEKVALLTQARTRRYEVNLVFVTTSDPEINVIRVAQRVEQNGHPVEPDAVRSRYASAMKLLPVAIEQADSVVVFDNSRDGKPPQIVAQKFNRGVLEIAKGPYTPEWVAETLQRDYDERLQSLATLARALKGEGHEDAPRVAWAVAENGMTYSGRMVAVTALHLLQEAEKTRFLVHARALAQDREYPVGGVAKVSYAYERGKIVPLEQTRAISVDKDR